MFTSILLLIGFLAFFAVLLVIIRNNATQYETRIEKFVYRRRGYYLYADKTRKKGVGYSIRTGILLNKVFERNVEYSFRLQDAKRTISMFKYEQDKDREDAAKAILKAFDLFKPS